MNELELRDKLKAQCDASNQTAVAESLGLTLSYVNDVLHMRRRPGPKMLRAMGLQQRITYVPLDEPIHRT